MGSHASKPENFEIEQLSRDVGTQTIESFIRDEFIRNDLRRTASTVGLPYSIRQTGWSQVIDGMSSSSVVDEKIQLSNRSTSSKKNNNVPMEKTGSVESRLEIDDKNPKQDYLPVSCGLKRKKPKINRGKSKVPSPEQLLKNMRKTMGPSNQNNSDSFNNLFDTKIVRGSFKDFNPDTGEITKGIDRQVGGDQNESSGCVIC